MALGQIHRYSDMQAGQQECSGPTLNRTASELESLGVELELSLQTIHAVHERLRELNLRLLGPLPEKQEAKGAEPMPSSVLGKLNVMVRWLRHSSGELSEQLARLESL
jgi:hypothetical protein